MPKFYLLSLGLALAVVALYSLTLYCTSTAANKAHNWLGDVGKAAPFILAGATIALHFGLVAPGRVSLLALPLGWALALGPHYIFSYYIDKPGFFGRKFTFQVLGIIFLAPSFAISLLLSLITWLRR